MQRKVFSVYDEKAEAYLLPFFLDTIGVAVRSITDCVNDPKHQFCAHASDYTLFLIAEYDDNTGSFKENRKSLGNLVEFKTQTPEITNLFEEAKS